MTKENEVVVKDEPHQGEVKTPAAMPVLADPFTNMVSMAVEKGLDIEQLTALMDLKDRNDAKVAKQEFNFALSKFQSEIPTIVKTGYADFGEGKAKYTYAKLDEIAKAIKPFLSINGLSYRYEQSVGNGGIEVTCIVAHSGGHEIKATMFSTPDSSGGKNSIQQVASAVQYMRRYTLTGALGITTADFDDDAANMASEQVPGAFINDSEYCTEEKFQKSFPAWEKQIKEGKKTPGELINFLNGKNLFFTEDQLAAINNVQVSK